MELCELSGDTAEGKSPWSYSLPKECQVHVYCLEEAMIQASKKLVPKGTKQERFPKMILPFPPKEKDNGIDWAENLAVEFVKMSVGQQTGVWILSLL